MIIQLKRSYSATWPIIMQNFKDKTSLLFKTHLSLEAYFFTNGYCIFVFLKEKVSSDGYYWLLRRLFWLIFVFNRLSQIHYKSHNFPSFSLIAIALNYSRQNFVIWIFIQNHMENKDHSLSQIFSSIQTITLIKSISSDDGIL